MKCWLALLMSILWVVGKAQDNMAFIGFVDKVGTSYSLNQPLDFLSQRALDRRQNRGVLIDSLDLPISQIYEDAVLNFNVEKVYASKWLNGILVSYTDALSIDSILQLPFVVEQTSVDQVLEKRPQPGKLDDLTEWKPVNNDNIQTDYGASYNQIHQINLNPLHDQGYLGQGVMIAVLDAGFNYADTMMAYQQAWNNGQIVATYDFVRDTALHYFGLSNHGQQVWSTIAANIDGIYVGTATASDYILFVTEDAANEYIGELYYWVVAAERADSIGVDIINTSLGYVDFDNPDFDFTHDDLDGSYSVIAQGVNAAKDRGIFCAVSAGNEGDKSWQKITTPADAFGSFTMGAVGETGNYAAFSSIGPTADMRVKPDVMARGEKAAVMNRLGYPYQINGTSFSAPIMAGAAACLIQKWPQHSVDEYYQQLRLSADRHTHPDAYFGYGIPNISLAGDLLTGLPETSTSSSPLFYQNNNELLWRADDKIVEINIYDLRGVWLESHQVADQNRVVLNLNQTSIYLVQAITINQEKVIQKLVWVK